MTFETTRLRTEMARKAALRKDTPHELHDEPEAVAQYSAVTAPAYEQGTRALTERGRHAIDKIIRCAIDIFIAEGYGGLSMRKVATKAGLALSNLQHYFANREALIAAVMKHTIAEYDRSYETILSDTTLTAETRFEAVVRMLVEDCKQPRTQCLFVNMWALAQTEDFARQIVEEAYAYQRRTISHFVEAVNPTLSTQEIACRAALITCQIEGLMVLIPQRNRFPSDIRGIEDEAVKAILALANAKPARQTSSKGKATNAD